MLHPQSIDISINLLQLLLASGKLRAGNGETTTDEVRDDVVVHVCEEDGEEG